MSALGPMIWLVSWTGLLISTQGRHLHQDQGWRWEGVTAHLYDSSGRDITATFHGQQHTRYRRDTDQRPGEPLLLDLVSDQCTLHVRLRDVGSTVAPSARIEWYEPDGGVTASRLIRDGCLYGAQLGNNSQNTGFLSLCHGISGVLESTDEDIFIKPAPNGRQSLTGSHVIERHMKATSAARGEKLNAQLKDGISDRRQAPEGLRCGTTEDYEHGGERVPSVGGVGDARGGRHRRQLYARGTKYMEVLLATDSSVIDFHGSSVAEQYLLTQLNIVNKVYQHTSLGIDLRVVVTKIIIIPDETASEIVTEPSGKGTLQRFCQWVNYEGQILFPHEGTHDIALFITRRDIGPAGYAPVTGMCNPTRSCTVNKDDGISSAFVIAHEIGHVMGLQHDGVGNDCDESPEDGKIMAAMVQSSYELFYWTTCAKERLLRYIDHYTCMNNKPVNPRDSNFEEPYGQSWSLDEQCRQEFGADFRFCEAFAHIDPCQHLWCSTRENPMLCKTKRGPPLPGTVCAAQKWCMAGRCTWVDSSAVDGGWASWSPWTECSRSCDTGVEHRRRTCTRPEPKNGGEDCLGQAEEFRLCNQQRCEGGPVDFRAEQCSWLNHLELIHGRRHTWLPLENKNVTLLCQLTCMSMETSDIIVTEESVIDGTFCSYEIANDICVGGRCQRLGCDGVLNSGAREDSCGVCMGHNDGCSHTTGMFDTRLVKQKYYKIITLPKGAREIFVQEMQSASVHFLAIKDEETGYYFFNGKGRQGHSKQFVYKGARFVYISRGVGESLAARGPLQDSISVLVFSKSNQVPVQVGFRFIAPNELRDQDWTVKYAEDRRILDATTPPPTTTTTRPPTTTTRQPPPTTTTKPPPTTTTTTQPPTTTTTQPTTTRPTTTTTTTTTTTAPPYDEDENYNKLDENVEEENVVDKAEGKEEVENEVEKVDYTYMWRFVDWSPCSVTCGEGEQSVVMACVLSASGAPVSEQACRRVPRPAAHVQPCIQPACPAPKPYRWVADEWAKCSQTCGHHGTQARRLHCMHIYYGRDYAVDPAYCNIREIPVYHRPCNRDPCPANWRMESWSKCSVTCGSGTQTRRVYCAKPRDGNPYVCSSRKPPTIRNCRHRYCHVITTTEATTTTVPSTTTSITTTTTTEPSTTTTQATTLPTTSTTTQPTTTTRTTTTSIRPPTMAAIATTEDTSGRESQAAPPLVIGGGTRPCSVDKSFFCKMASPKNCQLPLYRKFCCASCVPLI